MFLIVFKQKKTGILSQYPGPTSTYEKQPIWMGINNKPILMPVNKPALNSYNADF
jgi:ribulose 1,5-bisphosphate carboxylase large subunit-like protein